MGRLENMSSVPYSDKYNDALDGIKSAIFTENNGYF